MKNRLLSCILGIIGFLMLVALIDAASFTEIGDDILGRVFFATGYREIGSSTIVPAIEKTENCEGYTKIVLGDSVCNQVFNSLSEKNDDYMLLGTNQAVTMTGQYIFATRFLDTASEASDIYIVLLPSGFSSDFSSELSYSYFVEPFGKTDCFEYLSKDTIDKMEDYYGSFFVKKSIINFLDNSCINNKLYLYHNQQSEDEQTQFDLISQETEFYLKKLYMECKNRSIKLHILPSPMRDTKENRSTLYELGEEIEDKNLQFIFGDYVERATFYPDDMFKDGVHFADDYIGTDSINIYINNMVGETNYFEGLKY